MLNLFMCCLLSESQLTCLAAAKNRTRQIGADPDKSDLAFLGANRQNVFKIEVHYWKTTDLGNCPKRDQRAKSLLHWGKMALHRCKKGFAVLQKTLGRPLLLGSRRPFVPYPNHLQILPFLTISQRNQILATPAGRLHWNRPHGPKTLKKCIQYSGGAQ